MAIMDNRRGGAGARRRSRLAGGMLAVALAGLPAMHARAESEAVAPVSWTENFNGALARAGSELKPLLVVFSSPGCPWCDRLKSETLADKDVQAVLGGFICVSIDMTREPELARSFRVSGVPVTMVLSGDGRLQSVAEGFMDTVTFMGFLDSYRKGGGKRGAEPADLGKWLKALGQGGVGSAEWPLIMGGLGVKACRSRLHDALLAYRPAPYGEWIGLLEHPKLAVRLGALEILEEVAGSAYGYDPWADAEANRPAVRRWHDWAAGNTNEAQRVFTPLTEEQIAGYVRELASGDRERSARAVRMLEQAGGATIPVLEAWLTSSAAVEDVARRRIQEVRYFLLLPDVLGTERSRIAHRLVFGNQDERLRSLAAAAATAERALPVLAEFLGDPDPLIREAAVDNLIVAGKNKACPSLLELLKTEKDEEVIHAVVRGAAGLKGPKAVELVGRYLGHANEDLAVAALMSLGRTRSTTAANAVKDGLKDSRWRVRAAALEAIGKLRATTLEKEVAACLTDQDAFVRRSAVVTLAALSAKKSADRLTEVFLSDDQLKAPVVAALCQMDQPIPESFGPALKGKEPDLLLAVLEALSNGEGETWRLALPYVQHENTDVACTAIRIVASGGGGKATAADRALAAVLRTGGRERVLAVLEAYEGDDSQRGSRSYGGDPFGMDFSELTLPEVVLKQGIGNGPVDAIRTVVADGQPAGALADVFAAFSDGASGATVAAVAPAAGSNQPSAGGDTVLLQDIFGAFGAGASMVREPAAPVPAGGGVSNAPATGEAVALQDVFSAFGAGATSGGEGAAATTELVAAASSAPGAEAAPAVSAGARAVVREALAYLAPGQPADVRFAAALMLMSAGNTTGVAVVSELLDTRASEDRVKVAKRAAKCGRGAIQAVAPRLLRDASSDVREAAVSLCLGDSAGEAMLKELLAVALERGTLLTSRELFESSYRWYSAMRKTPLRKLLGSAAREVLGEKARDRYSDAQRIFAIVMLEACWKEGDRALLSDSLASENPFIRRAAWHALGLRQPDAFLENIQTVARDTSEWVRMVVPGVYDAQGSSQKIYFDVETVVDGLDSYGSSRNRKRLPKPVVDILNQMGGDAALQVRRAAAFCLLANREKTDVRALAAMVADERGGREMAYRVSSILEELPVTWLRELGTGDVLALLDAVDAADEDNERSRTLRKKLVVESAAPVVKPAVVTRKREAGLVVASGAEPVRREATQGDGAVARRLVVFFRNPGCKDCERVAEWLGALRAEFPDMAVEELDIRKPDDARVHEVLSERFEVPDRYHLTAPAIFCGGGYLIKGEITFERLGRLLGREESTETQWRQVDPVAMARADEVLGKHYAAMGPWMVAGAGLLDGVNPCAFATIIFLLSYLQVTRRTRGEILRVGSAFVAGVFIAYFLLGLGMVEVVVRFALLRRLGVALNWTMAGFVAVVAVLSAWDGVQCLRGRMGDMVLQLPGVLKAGIHAAVRRSVRQRQLVLAAFGAGLVIAVLELACTGQVYLPTLVYMLKTGQDHEGAVGLLFLYNVAFVVPLLVVFAGAYGGLRSERLTLWLQRRAALVKFALALLFAGLFMLFVFGALV